MAVILHIDTATEQASVGLSADGNLIQFLQSADQKNHAAFVQPAIQQLIQLTGLRVSTVDAIAVAGGPGSYTGLRVGLASAKGLCYAWKKPLIMVNTLVMIALAIREAVDAPAPFYICPMIDARRNEVFTAVYDDGLGERMQPQAHILTESSFSSFIEDKLTVFGGSGAAKGVRLIDPSPQAVFCETGRTARHLGILAESAYASGRFADLAYSEPFYCKEFFSPLV